MTDAHPPPHVTAEAIGWVVRVGDPAFADWEGFERWLAADPVHAETYRTAAIAEAEMVAVLGTASPAAAVVVSSAAFPPAAEPRRPRQAPWLWGGGAIAASLVAVVAYLQLDPATAPMRTFETPPGVSRAVALADGSRVTLGGGTRLLVAKDARTARLERGEGLFVVRHDASRPFRVAVGDAEIVDVGTVFDVIREARETRVQVAEGAIDWTIDGRSVRVDAGRRLAAADGDRTVSIGAVDPAAVGGWSRGELAFDGVPLATAAADLSRALGVAVAPAPGLSLRTVRGTVRLDGGADAIVPRFALLLGLRATRDGAGWRLTAPS